MKRFFTFLRPQPKPFDSQWILRVLVLMVVVLSLFSGYYFTKHQQLKREYRRLENTKFELMDIPVEMVE